MTDQERNDAAEAGMVIGIFLFQMIASFLWKVLLVVIVLACTAYLIAAAVYFPVFGIPWLILAALYIWYEVVMG